MITINQIKKEDNMKKRSAILILIVLFCVSLFTAVFVGCNDDKKPSVAEHTVTFDSVGGSEVAAVKGPVGEEPVPQKDGFVFGGWYTDKEFGGERIKFPFTPDADTEVYALWLQSKEGGEGETYTVTFDSAGGSRVAKVNGTVQSEPVPAREGYTFTGWYYSETSGIRVRFPYVPQSDVTLIAKWKQTTYSVSYVADKVVAAAMSKGVFDANKAFGAGVNIAVDAYKVGFKLYVDPDRSEDLRMSVAVYKAKDKLFEVFADDTNVYLVGAGVKKRFTNVDLAQLIAAASRPDAKAVTAGYNTAKTVLTLLFAGGNVQGKGEAFTMTSNLSNITELLRLIKADVPEALLKAMDQVDLRLDTDFSNGSLNKFDLSAQTKIGSVTAKITDFTIANGYYPGIEVPAKDAEGFDESYLVNFTLQGDVSLKKDNGDYTMSDIVKFDYVLRVDYNLAEALRNGIGRDEKGAVVFDASQMFNTHDSRILFDLYHKCTDGCEFCAGKEAKSKGSFLTIAYSPEDFGSQDVHVAVNAKYLLPKGWIKSVVGELPLGFDVLSLFGEYVGINIDPASLILKHNVKGGDASVQPAEKTEKGGFAVPDGMNVVDVALDVLDFVREARLSKEGGLQLSVEKILELVDDTSSISKKNVAKMLKPFFGGADALTIRVNKAVYGDPETNGINIYKEFLKIDDASGEYKSFGGKNFAKEVEWIRGNDGNVIITAGDVSTHDAAGDPVKLTAAEVNTLATSGSVKYTYTDIYGVKKDSQVGTTVIKTSGLDLNVTDKPQKVRVATTLADGGAISSLLNLVASFVPDFSLRIPGGVFDTELTVSSVKDIEFYQPAEVDDGSGKTVTNNAFDENKVYKYEDKLNPQFIARVTFTDGSVKETLVDPEGYKDKFYNYGTRRNASVKYFGTFDMVYNAHGRTFVKTVRMHDQLVQEEPTVVQVKAGEKYLVSKSATVSYNVLDEAQSVRKISVSGKEDMIVGLPAGVVAEPAYSNGLFGKSFNGINLTFANAGRYEITANYSYNASKKFVFEVSEQKVVPGYNVAITRQGKDTFKFVVSRANQYGNGLDVNVAVTVPVQDSDPVTLSPEDYVLFTKAGKEEKMLDKVSFADIMPKGYEFYLRITNEKYIPQNELTASAKVEVIAPDYDNAVVASAEFADRTEAYAITLGNEFVNSDQKSYEGKLLAVSPVCPDDKAVSGLTVDFEVTLEADGEAVELTSSDYKIVAVDGSGKAGYGYFKFTADGKYYEKTFNILFKSGAVTEKIDAATSVKVTFTARAKNYDNVVLASAASEIVKE